MGPPDESELTKVTVVVSRVKSQGQVDEQSWLVTVDEPALIKSVTSSYR